LNYLNTAGASDLSYPAYDADQWEAGSALTTLRLGTPHTGGMNIVYCDGHVKWMSASIYESPANISIWYPNPGYDN
jgi:prepilin-type processing-associated H-X9-DG protein